MTNDQRPTTNDQRPTPKGNHTMNDLERHNCQLFLGSLDLLHVDDDGLTDATHFDDVKAIAQTCPLIREITPAGDTPYLLALNRLATLTERVCLTWGRPDRQAVKQWLIARAELLLLQIPRV